MVNKLEEIKISIGEESRKNEKRVDMARVTEINKASVELFDALKQHVSSLTEAEADILTKRLTHEFEDYLAILLRIRKAAFERRKEHE